MFNVLQKTNIIRDYLEDINEIPKSRMFWPREIWSKYVDKLEVYLFLLLNKKIYFITLYTRLTIKELIATLLEN